MPTIRTSTECTAIADIFLDIAEIMVDQNCAYYDELTRVLRDKLWEDHKINLTTFKTYSLIDSHTPEQICDMMKHEQLMFVLFAAQMCLTGDIPT